jgi:hypothetical protein
MPARAFLTLAVALLLAACNPPQLRDNANDVAEAATEAMTDTVADGRTATAEAVLPTLLAVQDAAAVVAEPLPAPPARDTIAPEAVALIVRYEISSPAVYTRRYEHPLCPGGASGPTIGIGYDLGQQTAARIGADWADHPDVARMVTASGQVGPSRCAAWRARNADIRTPIALAQQVFAGAVLPDYVRQAGRAMRKGWDGLAPMPKGASVSMGFNRGWSMAGSRNAEKRVLRDTCVPEDDAACVAAQLRGMQRLWPGAQAPNPGLRARREAEAKLAERAS